MLRVTYDGESRTAEFTGILCSGELVPITPETELEPIVKDFVRRYGRRATIELTREEEDD